MTAMFRKQLVLAAFLLVSLLSRAQNNPFYYEHIFNETKTINFVFTFYPTSYQHFELKERDTCTTFKSFIINKTTGSMTWDNYKVRLQLKNGKLVNNLSAAAKDGKLATSYTVAGSDTHTQFFCFNDHFTGSDIGKIWLVMADDKVLELEMYKNDK
jgi:hypothetical protein